MTKPSDNETSANGAEAVLVAEKVTKRFPGTIALDGVDFTVYAGAVNVLIGENGAGKSTLMKILAGVDRPTSGRLLLKGRSRTGGRPVNFFRQYSSCAACSRCAASLLSRLARSEYSTGRAGKEAERPEMASE